ncbi:MAG: hypothetical protein M1834_007194 [Cirrosporium novae-zelandiae]|nr:MAG: hypothetical protein M1834_007194 [Cirrosporium novae-zelandiae]
MATSKSNPNLLRFETHHNLTNRLVLSTLTGHGLKITKIRPNSPTAPGLAPHEISFLHLLDNITNGSYFEVSVSGSNFLYKPGLLTPSTTASVITHTIPRECKRGVTYFIIPLLSLLPFAQKAMSILFTGPGCITAATSYSDGNGGGDISIDSLRTALLPLLQHFGIPPQRIELRILQRSNGPDGAGSVRLDFSAQVRLPKTLHLLNPGRITRVRGVASCIGISASNNARMITAARGILNPLVPNVYIFSDVSSAADSSTVNRKTGRKPGIGMGLSLVAETSTNCIFSADTVSPPSGLVSTPEDLGKQCAYQLLETIAQGGCVPKAALSTVLVLMQMGSQDVGRLRVGKSVLGQEGTIRLAREMKEFGAAGWGVRDAEAGDMDSDDEDDGGGAGEKIGADDVIVSVVGSGIGNVGRKVA